MTVLIHFDTYLREFDACYKLLAEASKAEAQRSMPTSSAAPASAVAAPTQRLTRWSWLSRRMLHCVFHVGRAQNITKLSGCTGLYSAATRCSRQPFLHVSKSPTYFMSACVSERRARAAAAAESRAKGGRTMACCERCLIQYSLPADFASTYAQTPDHLGCLHAFLCQQAAALSLQRLLLLHRNSSSQWSQGLFAQQGFSFCSSRFSGVKPLIVRCLARCSVSSDPAKDGCLDSCCALRFRWPRLHQRREAGESGGCSSEFC